MYERGAFPQTEAAAAGCPRIPVHLLERQFADRKGERRHPALDQDAITTVFTNLAPHDCNSIQCLPFHGGLQTVGPMIGPMVVCHLSEIGGVPLWLCRWIKGNDRQHVMRLPVLAG